MNRRRETLQTDIILMITGPGMIAVAFLRMGNNISYPPGDPRAEPWFDPAIAVVLGLMGVFVFAVGAVRLLQGLRDRHD